MQKRDWWLHARIGRELDHRRKLNDQDKKDILHLFNIDKLPIRQIAREYEKVCSRRLIQLVIYPERREVIKQRQIKKKSWLLYYNKDKRKEYQRTHRQNIRDKFKLNSENKNKLKVMIINRKTKQEIKDHIIQEKLTLRQYKSNNDYIPASWSINEQRAYIQGMEMIRDYIITQEKEQKSLSTAKKNNTIV